MACCVAMEYGDTHKKRHVPVKCLVHAGCVTKWAWRRRVTLNASRAALVALSGLVHVGCVTPHITSKKVGVVPLGLDLRHTGCVTRNNNS